MLSYPYAGAEACVNRRHDPSALRTTGAMKKQSFASKAAGMEPNQPSGETNGVNPC